MQVQNFSYYMSLSKLGLLFASADSDDPHIYKLQELNETGLRFVMAIKMMNSEDEISRTIAIFEKRDYQ